MALNVAFAAVAAIIVLSNLLFFPFGPGTTRQAAKAPGDPAPPEASAPVIVDLPAPRASDAQPGPENGAGEEDASALPQIEPAAPPPPDAAASLPPASEPVPEAPAAAPDVVASLPPAGEAVPEAPAVAPDVVAALPPTSARVPEISATPMAPPTQMPAADAAVSALPSDEIEALTRRGDALLVTGDIIAARLAYERAARAGSATAATGVGKTFDPLFLAAAGVRGIQGNPFEAAAWYRRGSAAGDLEAESRLQALRRQFPE